MTLRRVLCKGIDIRYWELRCYGLSHFDSLSCMCSLGYLDVLKAMVEKTSVGLNRRTVKDADTHRRICEKIRYPMV